MPGVGIGSNCELAVLLIDLRTRIFTATGVSL